MAHSVREHDWSAVVADFRRSGLTQFEFCRRRHISIDAFRYRLYSPQHRLLTSPSPEAAPGAPPASKPTSSFTSQFLPVHVRPRPITPAHHGRFQGPAPLELVLGNEQFVRIPVGFDPATLGRLLDLLEDRS
jgi:hypothetical protein